MQIGSGILKLWTADIVASILAHPVIAE